MPKLSELPAGSAPTGTTLPNVVVLALQGGQAVTLTLEQLAQLMLTVESRAPTTSDNAAAGYAPGWRWIYGNRRWTLTQETAGSATWVEDTTTAPPSTTLVTNPGGTWAPSLADGDQYRLEIDEDCAVTFTGGPTTDGDVHWAILYVERNGHELTFVNGNSDDSVDLTSPTGVVESLAIEMIRESGATTYRVHQWDVRVLSGSSVAPITGIVSAWPLESDADDAIGQNDLTLVGGASIIGSGKNGLSLTEASGQAATVADRVVNVDADFTAFIAFNWDDSKPGDDHTILGWGNAGSGIPYLFLYLSKSGSTGQIRVVAKNDTDTSSASLSINLARGDTPNGDQLWMLRRNGSTLTLRCLTNDVEVSGAVWSGTVGATQFAIGARPTGASLQHHWDGQATHPIYRVDLLDRAVTSSVELNQMRNYYQQARSLPNV